MRWRRRHEVGDPLVCREFVELVTDYLDGALPEGERIRFEAHLAECDGCAGYLEDTRRLVGSLHEVSEPSGRPRHPRGAAARLPRPASGQRSLGVPVASARRDRLVRHARRHGVDRVVQEVDGDLLLAPEDERRGDVERG